MSCKCGKNNSSSCGCDDCFSGVGLPNGADGETGLSAYAIAVLNGFVGTEPEWLLSLNGSDGADGADGADGSNGTNGTNAFKYIKEFETSLDGGGGTISLAEITTAGGLPVGYIQDGGASAKCDFTIQCWIQNNDPTPSGIWYKSTDTDVTAIGINEATGLITIVLGGGSNDVILRVVITG
jgi:hypothetical protein